MPAPQTNFVATDKSGYDPATLSDNEDDDSASLTSRSTWASSSDATILGFADGFLTSMDDAADWRVSRIGGLPSFPLARAPEQAESSTCRSCRNPMPLLTQVYCPLESSSLERVVYVFACPRTACRKRDGSIRAFRANRIWKESPEEKLRIEEEKNQKSKLPKAAPIDLGGLVFGGTTLTGPSASSTNPFASSNPFAPASNSPVSNPFAPSGTSSSLNPFASTPPPPSIPPPAPVASTSTTVVVDKGEQSSTWPSGPSYPAQYITTSYEPGSPKLSLKALPPMSNLKIADDSVADEEDEGGDEDYNTRREGKGSGGRTKKGSGGGKGRYDGSGSKSTGVPSTSSSGGGGRGGAAAQVGEGYEVQRVKGVDEIFLRFQERVSREGLQVIRYEHNTQPLAFSGSSTAYKTLYPPSPLGELGSFTPSRLPTCRTCRQPCVFEYQLMPNLISVLNRTQGTKGTSAYSTGEGKDTVASKDKDEGLDWATVWVFACGAECAEKSRDKESWREESVMVEWEE
ncbi:small subunit rRNA maturation protein TSR4 [Sporobolomyces koalae]|uniref:small subunit rRNA maturation protein TSR4 n=1 Tax=Sporobolomyces koalae TaxID=500713 RepID=UPI00316E64D6